MAAPGDAWFYADGRGGSIGPYPRPSFASIAASGALPPATPVYCAGVNGGAWLPLADAAKHLGVQLPAAPGAATAAPPTGGPPSPPPDEREFTDDDGTHFVWDGRLRRFVPKAEGATPGAPAYNEDDMTFPSAAAPPPRRSAKPTAAEVIAKHVAAGKRAREAAEKEGAWDAARAARAAAVSVYVAGLPPDATKDEVASVFAKCGVLKPAPDGSGPRVKLYTDEAGALKGDGVVTFLKPPSVDLALTLLDGARFRPDDARHVLTVTRAEFSEKQGGRKDGGDRAPPAPPLSKKARKAMTAAVDRALGWDGDDDAVDDPVTVRTVVLRGAFDDARVAAAADRAALERALVALAADVGGGGVAVRARAHAGGVAVLRYGTGEAAARAVSRLCGRAWRGRELDADLWDGVERFGVLGGKPKEDGDDAARLAAFAAELEAKGGADVGE